MIDVRGLYKSFEDKTVLSDINASFENGKTNGIDEMYRRITYSREGGSAL